MRVLHTADWHLGMDLYEVTLMEDQRWFKQQLKAIIEGECIDAVLVAGGVYDTILTSKEAIGLYGDIMCMLCMELEKKAIIIADNHDSVTRLTSLPRLLEGMGLYIIGSLKERVKGIRVDDYIIYPIPYFHVKQIRKVYQEGVHSQTEAFSCICTGVLSTADHTYRPITMARAFLTNIEVCEGDRFANVGGAELVPSTIFDEFSYVAMGHLCRRQHAGERVQYSGSPLPYSFSEANQPKGMLIYDNQTDTVTERDVQPLHPLQVCKGSCTNLKERMLEHTVPDRAYMKTEVTDLPVSYEMLDYFRQGYENLLQLSGKSIEQGRANITIRLQGLETISDLGIVQQFFQDYYGGELSEAAGQLFLQAQQKLEREEMHAT